MLCYAVRLASEPRMRRTHVLPGALLVDELRVVGVRRRLPRARRRVELLAPLELFWYWYNAKGRRDGSRRAPVRQSVVPHLPARPGPQHSSNTRSLTSRSSLAIFCLT